MKRSVVFAGLFLAFSAALFCQRPQNNVYDADRDLLIERLVETMAENMDGTADYTSLFQDLTDFYEAPLNLNEATREDIEKFKFLTTFQIENWWEYLEKHSPVYSIFELALIKGFDEETIRSLMPFIRVAPAGERRRVTVKDFFRRSKNELFLRYGQTLQQAKGYSLNKEDPDRGYLGSPQAVFMRYRFRYKDKVSMGFTADKDAGEPFFAGKQKYGFDFYSAHLFVRNVSVFKRIAVGDFKAQFGRGLTFWTGFAFGKSSFGANVQRNGTGLSPHTSVNESLFLRGGGFTVNPLKGLDITVFSSYKMLDANVAEQADADDSSDMEITSLPVFGLHRTQTENAKRRTMGEWISGGNVSYRHKNIKVGITAVYTKFGGTINPKDDLYRKFEFRGRELGNVGIDYTYVLKNIVFFGETAWSSNGGWATVNGIQAQPATFLTLSVHQRYFSKEYSAFYATALSESAARRGEFGIYAGLECKPAAKVSVSGFVDMFSFPWLRYQTNSPSVGYDVLGQINYKPVRKVEFYVRYRQRMKPLNVSGSLSQAGIKPVEDRETGRFRFHLSWQAALRWRIQARAEWVSFKKQAQMPQHGYMAYADLSYAAVKKPFSVHTRLGIFHTEGFDTRLYAYESDVLYYYGFVPLYDKGFRAYLSCRYEVFRNLDIWLKVGNTSFVGKTDIGSGNAEITGNNRTDVRAQLRFKF